MNTDIIEKYYDLTDMSAPSVAKALGVIRDELAEINISLSSLVIEHPLTDEEMPRIAVLYYELDEEDIENNKDYLAFAKEDYTSEDKLSIYINEAQLQFAQIYNNPDDLDLLSSLPQLLQKVIDYLGFKSENEVLDLVYIDQINSDALHVPSIRIYSRKERAAF